MPIFQGTAYYAKVVGKPQPGYDKTQLEWSTDVAINDATRKSLIKLGVGDYIKNKGDKHASGGDYLSFKRPAVKKDGTPGKPIRIVDNKGKPWDNTVLIGNGSVVNVNFALNEKASGGLKPSLIAMQVWEHVPYEPKDRDDDFPVVAGAEDEDWSSEAA